MTVKGYVFCTLMAAVALLSWFRPITPAIAAAQPAYEYAVLPAQLGTDEAIRQLNAAGAKGWRSAGGVCIKLAENGSPFCDNTLLVRERR